MVDRLHFPSKEAAQILRDEYFERFHSTAKVSSRALYCKDIIGIEQVSNVLIRSISCPNTGSS